TPELPTLSLHDALPIYSFHPDLAVDLLLVPVELLLLIGHQHPRQHAALVGPLQAWEEMDILRRDGADLFGHTLPECLVLVLPARSEEHTSELQSRENLV